MGLLYSMLFDKTTKHTFMSMSEYEDIHRQLTEVTKEQINVPIERMDYFVEKVVDFIMKYISIPDLMKCGHSDAWSKFMLPEDPTERREAIKENVVKMLSVSESKKEDQNLAKYLERFVCNLIDSECGGFMLNDIREHRLNTAIDVLHEQKKENMYYFVSSEMEKNNGIVVCIEHDQDSCLPESEERIKFHRFSHDVHSGNMAKAVYYTGDMTIREFHHDEVKQMMVTTKNDKYIDSFDACNDRFVVFSFSSSTEGSEFSEETVVVGIHGKSNGSKKNIFSDRNQDEYRLIASVVDSYRGGRLIVMGDFNVPTFDEGREFFKLVDDDEVNYPLSESSKSDSVITKGLMRYSRYSTDDVMSKTRMDHLGYNVQVLRFKRGPRSYNTDHIYSNIPFDEEQTTSKLYPVLDKTNMIPVLPLITNDPKTSWCSDHQASIVQINTTKLVVYNTLSNACSMKQPFKTSMDCASVESAREECMDLVSELCNIIY